MTLDKNVPMGHSLAMQTVAETRHYLSRAEKLLTPKECEKIVMTLAVNPLAGALIEGTGGLRKMRFARDGRGKSGGVRVVCYYHSADMPTVLLEVFGKNEKDNLTKAERNVLARVVAELKRGWRRKGQ